MLADAAVEPGRHGLLALLRRIAATDDHLPPPGRARRPSQETFRLGQQASMAFAARELAQVSSSQGRAVIRLFGLGLLGPGGALPTHYTETVYERALTRRDTAPGDFLDLFHHRAFSHFYRAWSRAQAAAGLDRAGQETFTRYIAWLSGDEARDVAGHPLPRHARWASAAHRVRPSRNPEGLVRTLGHYFGVPVALREYVLRWMPVEPVHRSRLGRGDASARLGHGALAGAMVPDRQAQFRLVIGPLGLRQYLRFTPGPSHADVVHGDGGLDDHPGRPGLGDLPALVEWVRAFVGFEYAWDVELRVRADEIPTARLGGSHRLGWSAWLAGAGATDVAADDGPVGSGVAGVAGNAAEARARGAAGAGTARGALVFQPEQYLRWRAAAGSSANGPGSRRA
ncbi:type VI secretion system baseplate subunit TssG [Xylophilus sp. GOD-11R]|uniref:type VI secretion system baseplate subunit TssG n=1 Tax=Xylophilus sp. GOD-11R TaxID=3089814 RepID=UPI00298CB2F9|nr:type VI secretion system baseplate subunit TssG [Xylophilus sp. GOD-11R]WPB55351.1 type VI secretion system baseplate subunit TssG [Xylophilus sp. GOD-11R]